MREWFLGWVFFIRYIRILAPVIWRLVSIWRMYDLDNEQLDYQLKKHYPLEWRKAEALKRLYFGKDAQ